MKEFMRSDRAKHNIIPPSKFGIIEITRQRVRPQTEIKTTESCPTCGGTGEIQASILFAEEIEANLSFLLLEVVLQWQRKLDHSQYGIQN
jgi:ribonuclease G